jgi:hypothetical protein
MLRGGSVDPALSVLVHLDFRGRVSEALSQVSNPRGKGLFRSRPAACSRLAGALRVGALRVGTLRVGTLRGAPVSACPTLEEKSEVVFDEPRNGNPSLLSEALGPLFQFIVEAQRELRFHRPTFIRQGVVFVTYIGRKEWVPFSSYGDRLLFDPLRRASPAYFRRLPSGPTYR